MSTTGFYVAARRSAKSADVRALMADLLKRAQARDRLQADSEGREHGLLDVDRVRPPRRPHPPRHRDRPVPGAAPDVHHDEVRLDECVDTRVKQHRSVQIRITAEA